MLRWLRTILCNFRRKPLTPSRESRATPLGDLGYRAVNLNAELEEGVKRARKRQYAVKRKDVKDA
jgi:hypothetical protein